MSDRDTLADLIYDSRDDSANGIADAVIAAGWRPPAQVIETPENEGDYTAAIAALDALPHDTVIKIRSYVYQGIGSGWWEAIGRRRQFSTEQVVDVADGDSVTVLYAPTEKAES
ncbi:hypothetical protein [Nocardia sp. NPDC051463]|uniref:hypothetical protein n=1 Tax=Nocardia sp. NPDC051463 TaxID=3154845 RepID=UPI00344B96B7